MAEPAVARQASEGSLVAPANRSMPPGRVRRLFKSLDADGDGRLTLQELMAGFETEFGELTAHAKEAIPAIFEARAEADETHGKSLKINVFSRFYAEILFRHFDTNHDGALQLEEAHEALKFMTKPGAQPAAVAFPAEAYTESGELRLPMSWFWSIYQAMD